MWRRTVQGENILSSQKILLDGDGADHARVIVLNTNFTAIPFTVNPDWDLSLNINHHPLWEEFLSHLWVNLPAAQ